MHAGKSYLSDDDTLLVRLSEEHFTAKEFYWRTLNKFLPSGNYMNHKNLRENTVSIEENNFCGRYHNLP